MFRRFALLGLSAFFASVAVAEPPGYYFLHFQPNQLAMAPYEGEWLVSGSLTVELWLHLDEAPTERAASMCFQAAIGLDWAPPESETAADRWWIPNDPGGWSFFLKTTEGVVGTSPIELPVGSWIHVAATYDGAILRLYVDGKEVASIPHSGIFEVVLDPGPLYLPCFFWPEVPVASLGDRGNGDQDGLKGSLRDVAVWNSVVSAMDLAAKGTHPLTGLEPGLIHYWPLDDGADVSQNLVPDAPTMILGRDPLAEGPDLEPEWQITDPFYLVREDWIEDVPSAEGVSMMWWISNGVADFNQDGHDDFIANLTPHLDPCTPIPNPIGIMLNDGTGQFIDGSSSVIDGPVPEPLSQFRTVVADFNGDDLPDVFVGDTGIDWCDDVGWTNTLMLTNQDGKLYDASENLLGAPCTSTVPLYEGQAPCYLGGGLFGRPPGVRYPDINAPLTTLHRDYTHSTAAGDIDGDGDTDIFVGNIPFYDSETAYFLLNDGTGNFVANWDFVAPRDPMAPGRAADFANSLIADIDGDDSVDLLVCCETEDPDAPPGTPDGTLKGGVYWGDGSGDFSSAPYTAFPRPSQDYWISTGGLLPIDIDGDGDQDLVVGYDNGIIGWPARNPDDTPLFVQVLVNQGDRQFADESAARILTPVTMLSWLKSFYEVDFNVDGCPDFVLEHAGYYWKENILLNDCSGRFTALHPAVVGKLRQLLPIDVHGDGDLDFVSYREGGGGFPGDFAILEKVQPYITTLFWDKFESGDTSKWSSTEP